MTDRATRETDALKTLDRLLDLARKAGAEAADAVLFEAVSLSASCRLGKPEDLERSEGRDVGLRILHGKRQSYVSSSDTSDAALVELVERANAMAKAAPEDPWCGLNPPELAATDWPDLDLFDASEPDAETLIARAYATEAAALAVDGVTNSEGGSAGFGSGLVALATSTGFAGSYSTSSHSLSASVIAGSGTEMEGDYAFSSARFLGDLETPEIVGEEAGTRAVRRLNPRRVDSQQVPVVMDPRVSNSLLGHFTGAISGIAVARGTSFLKDSMGEAVFPSTVRVVDDPLRVRGLRSKPFDGEGMATARRDLIADGVLQTWLLDGASARQLGLSPTGHASRGTTSPPSPSSTNLYLEPGQQTPAELIAGIDRGLYVTDLIGFGVNGVTGDYSRGAGGFWIEDGEISYPVTELTIAGNLKDMFLNLTAADDLVFRYGTNAPTIRLDGMTVAGN